MEGLVPFVEVRILVATRHFFAVFLNLLLDRGRFGFVQLLGQFISNLEQGLLGFLAFWEFVRVFSPCVVDFVLQLRMLKFVQICLPGLHRFCRRAQFQNTPGTNT